MLHCTRVNGAPNSQLTMAALMTVEVLSASLLDDMPTCNTAGHFDAPVWGVARYMSMAWQFTNSLRELATLSTIL